jgi:(p)ppGpp synthase/HD superfamily hydrolase
LREEIRLQTAEVEAPLSNEDVAKQLVKQSEHALHREVPSAGAAPILGVEGLDHRLGGCCSPLPGEPILGAVALGNHGITIHRQDCANLEAIPTERRLPVRWNPSLQEAGSRFPAHLRIEVIDRVGILKDILMRLSDGSINVSDARVRTAYGKPARIDLMVELGSSAQLQRTMAQIRSMADVIDIARTGQS